jgi:P27 family predicted phage terminase small subunit
MAKNTEIQKLSDEAQKLYQRIAKEWSITDSAGRVTLLTACQALDRMREAQEILKKEGAVTADRFGQPKIHPAAQLEKEARAGLLMSLKALNMDLESLEGEDDA